MARRAFKVTRSHVAGGAVMAFILALVVGSLGAVLFRAGPIFSPALSPPFGPPFGPSFELNQSDWLTIRFTMMQASLSALISLLLAIPLARAISRRAFVGRQVLILLMGAPFILPVMVAVLGLLAVFGRAGIVNAALGLFGIEPVSIYGLQGVVIAHVFFNLPLATRLILQGWQAIPGEQFRLAASLGFSNLDVARELEIPMLRRVVPGVMLVVFLVCLTSFAVALTMGGGPRATTIELAIYQAVRLDFDLARAAFLAVIQLIIGAIFALLALKYVLPDVGRNAGLGRAEKRWEAARPILKIWDTGLIMLAAAFLVLPICMVVLNGIPGLAGLSQPVWLAALRSVTVALGATGLALGMALAICALVVLHGWSLAGIIGMLGIVASPLVIGTGLFIMIHPIADPGRYALVVTGVINAVMALPFVLRAILPALSATEADFGRLADGLAMRGWARLRGLWLPRMRRPLGFSAGLVAALSMGDLGVVALFAAPDQATLPLQVYRLMGAYRMQDAAAAGLLLLCLSLALFWVFDRKDHRDA